MADLSKLLDLQFDITNNNGSSDLSPGNLMKRMSALRQLRDPYTMNRLAQMSRQRQPIPPPSTSLQAPPGRFNNFRYPPAPQPYLGAPPPPQFPSRPPGFQDPALFYDEPESTRNNNQREFLFKNFKVSWQKLWTKEPAPWLIDPPTFSSSSNSKMKEIDEVISGGIRRFTFNWTPWQ